MISRVQIDPRRCPNLRLIQFSRLILFLLCSPRRWTDPRLVQSNESLCAFDASPRRCPNLRLVQSCPRTPCLPQGPRRCPDLRLVQSRYSPPSTFIKSSKVSRSQVGTMGSLQNGIPPAGMPFCYCEKTSRAYIGTSRLYGISKISIRGSHPVSHLCRSLRTFVAVDTLQQIQ